MKTSTAFEVKHTTGFKVRRFFILLSIIFLSLSDILGQAPVWVAGTPSVVSTGPLSITMNYGINKVGTVYIAIYNFNNPTNYTSATVKSIAGTLPAGSLVATKVIPIGAGNINNILQTLNDVLNISTLHTIYIVAEGTPGGLQAVPIKLFATTLPCPMINVLTGFTQPVVCVNKTTTATFDVVIANPNPTVNGILKGTQWTLDWGDGTVATYISSADNNLPPLATRTHTYSSVTDCNYVFSNGIRNPCGQTRAVQYVAIVHGRDIPADGDGVLEIVDDATGSTTINVCAGTQTTVTLRDNSTWNCQNPVLPGGLTAVPNLDPRNIEWLYGRDPLGAITNTITGAVNIATLGNAPRASGRLSPIAAPGTLSRAITIPATCVAGQYFRVYLKNWNICNWTDPEYVNTFVDIRVIAAPPAPTIASKTICFGDNRTLTVTSPVVGTIYWYSNAALTSQVATGTSYTQPQTAAGNYTYWVVDRSSTGLQCQSPVKIVSIGIREALSQPSIITGVSNTCPSVSGLTYSVVGDPPVMTYGGATQYVWSVPAGLTIAGGQGTRQITVDVGATSGNKSISVYLQYTSAPSCNSNTRSKTLTVYSIVHNPGTLGGGNVCASGTVSITNTANASTGNPASAGPSYSWDRAAAPGFGTWTPLAGTANNFSETMAVPGTYRYRRTATFGCGAPVSVWREIIVYSTTVNGGAIGGVNICEGGTASITNTTAASTGVPASAGPVYSWDRAPGPLFTVWTPLVGSANNFSETMATPGTYRYRRTATYGCGTPATATRDIIVNPLPIPSISGDTGPCFNNTRVYTTPSVAGNTYSWSVANGTISGSSINNSVTVIWNVASGPGSVSVTETKTSTGCVSAALLFIISVNPSAPGAAGAIAGPANVCYAQTGVGYSIAAVANASNYVWTLPAGVTLASGAGTRSITVDFAAGTASPVTISVYPENGCGTGASSSRNINIYNQLNGGTIGSNQTICNGADVAAFTSSASASGGAGTFTYTWQYTTNMAAVPGGAGWTNIGASNSTTYNYGTLTTTTKFVRRAIEGTCSTPVYSNEVTITVRPALNGGNIGTDQTICNGADVAAFTSSASAIGGAGTFTYTWQYTTNMAAAPGAAGWTDIGSSNSTTYNYGTLTTTTRFVRKAEEGTCTTPVYSNVVTVTVRPALNGGTIGSDQTICNGADVNNFTSSASASGGAGTFTYTWQYTTNMAAVPGGAGWTDIGSSNSTTYDYGTLSSTTKFVRKAVEGTCTTPVYSNEVTVTVRPALSGGAVGTDQTICNGADVAGFTSSASASGGAGTFTYTWQYTTNMAAVPGGAGWTNIGSSNSTTIDYGALTTTTKFVRRAVDLTCITPVYSNEITITVRPALNGGTIGTDQTICNGADVAAFTSSASASGGAGTFTYTWQYTTNMALAPGAAGWTDIASSNSTTYNYGTLTTTTRFVRKAEEGTCTTPVYSNVVTVTVRPALSGGTIGSDQTICNGADVNNFTNSASASGGAGTFTYTWQYTTNMAAVPGGAGWTDIGSSNSTTYDYGTLTTTTKFVRKAVEGTCTTPVYSNEVTVTVRPALSGGAVGSDQTICNGADVAAFTSSASASGGAGTFTYTWQYTTNMAAVPGGAGWTNIGSSNSTTIDYGTLTTTTKFVRRAVDGTCSTPVYSNEVTITVRPALVGGTVGSSQPICSGADVPAFTSSVDASGGAGIFTYTWQYTVNMAAVPGDGNWTDIASSNSTTYNHGTLAATTKFVRKAVEGTCTAPVYSNVITITVVQPPATSEIGGGGKTTMCTGTNGQFYSVDLHAGNTYNWTVPAGTTKAGGGNAGDNFIVLNFPAAGVYTLTVQESTSVPVICAGPVKSLVITVYNSPVANAGPDRTICAGDNATLGAVLPALSGSGGSGTFTYLWIPSIGLDDATIANPVANPNSTRMYTLNVTDVTSGCATVTDQVTVTVNPLPTAYNVSGPAYYCYASGGITLTLSGSQLGVNYQLYNGGAPSGAVKAGTGGGLNWPGLFTGSYTVRATNPVTLCQNTMNGSVTVAENPDVVINSVTPIPPSCFSSSDGVISIAASGGTGALSYSVNNGATFQSSPVFGSLAPGNYDIVVKDIRGCTKTTAQLLTAPTPVTITLFTETNSITCFGGSDGSIRVSVNGGTPGYDFQWYYDSGLTNPLAGMNTDEATGLAAGTYWVKITDFNGCWISGNTSIGQPAVLNGVVTPTMVTCNSANDGIITITSPTGGTNAYEYRVNGGAWQASGTFGLLAPDTYTVEIRDAGNPACIRTLNSGMVITEPAPLNAAVSSTNISCFGANNGTITISSPAGGYGTYEYSVMGSWQATGSFTALIPGTYIVSIRDKAHPLCVKVLDPGLIITEPDVLSATVSSTNVTCFGANNGTITISSPTGGYGTYSYSINGGTSWQISPNFTNLAPSTYNIRIRDAVNQLCIIALNPPVVITQPDVLSATVASTNVSCYGLTDGTITITNPLGGSLAYDYSINGGADWQATGIFTNVAPGFYNVQIRDKAAVTCVKTLNGSLQVTQPQVLSASVSKTNVNCFGVSNGTITVTSPSGGYGTYDYSIGGAWQASGSFTGLAPATYVVSIRDRAYPACVIILNGGVVISGPDILAASVATTDVTCFGANDGTISITTPSGGSGTYQYNIGGPGWVGSGMFTNLANGTYTVSIRDAASTGCIIVLGSYIIGEPDVLSADYTKTNVSCFGTSDGTITITNPLGGSGSYEYSINGGGSWQATGTYTALAPGFYNVEIRDLAHQSCVIVLNNSLQVTQPAVLNGVVTPTMVTCNSANDGIITITSPTGGTGAYEYRVNGGAWQVSGTFAGLAPDTYVVEIRDAGNLACIRTLNSGMVITEPAPLNAAIASTNITCFGANNGTITISSPAGGYGTYEYSIGGLWQATGSFTALIPGTYVVSIRDKAHPLCVKVFSPNTVITEPVVLSATVSSTNVTCFGANNGTITISSPAGGYGTYSYSINGGTSWQPSPVFTNLAPSTYNIRIRDAVNQLCIIALNPPVVITQPAVLNAAVASTNVTCFGSTDGTITISAPTGGYGTYEYSINGGSSWEASGSYSGVAPGFYNIQIRDALNTTCVKTLNGSLQITQPQVLSASISKTNVNCFGANNGSINITSPNGGYGTYDYSIGAGWQPAGSFAGLAPASYVVSIRDRANPACVIILDGAVVISEPAVLAAGVATTDVTCFGANDGTISITTPSGGSGTYQYSINGATWAGSGMFINLAPNTYNVRIRDAASTGCIIALGSYTIAEPVVLSAGYTKTDVSCFGTSDGTITITNPLGGSGNYEYSINGGGSWQATGTYTILPPGFYNVQIRDAAHISCVIVLNNSLQITQPAVLNGVVTPTMVTCNAANDGIITITSPTGGTGAYEYRVNGGTWQASGTFGLLAPDTYTVEIRDAGNPACIRTLNSGMVITEPAPLNAAVSSTNISCFGANNGTITISSPAGGYGTYEYSVMGSWQATGSFTALIPGTYIVSIRDKAHPLCVKVLDPGLIITEPDVLSATVSSTNVTCFGANNGTITISSPTGGYGTYSYSINGGTSWQISPNFTNLAPSTYNIRIRDAVNQLCIIALNPPVVITQPDVLSATVASTNVSCYGLTDGTITITNPLGGSLAYDYSINGGADWQATGIFTNVAPGFYNVQMRDRAAVTCVITLNGSLQVTQPQVLSASVSKTNVNCFGVSNGTITVTSPSGGYGTYDYSIGGAWQASGSFTGLAPATYAVSIRDRAYPACVIILNGGVVISGPDILAASVASTDVTCFGANDGTISITTPSGGSGTYQYNIGGPGWVGSGMFTNLANGTYTVSIRDAASTGCIIVLGSYTIGEPDVLSADYAKTNVSCFGTSDGTITITNPLGGSGSYEYSINGGGSWQATGTYTALAPGFYNVEIRDLAHQSCVIVLNNSLQVTQPAVLNGVVTPTMVTCNSANDGIITITGSTGGTGAYQYRVNGGAWQVSGTFAGLAPDTYIVEIRDAGNLACIRTLNSGMVITEPAPLNAAIASTNITCFGANNGTITISSPAGGYGTYEYSIGGIWQATGSFTALIPGTYVVSIRDKAHPLCVKVFSPNTVITEPVVLSATVSSTNVTCFGANNGTITISSPAGGYGTYSYSINGGTSWQPSPVFTNLAPSTYNIRIRDAVNQLCIIALNPPVVITQPDVLSATVASTNVSCYGLTDGTITITNPLGGSLAYDYSINGGADWQATGIFTNVAPGFYNVQIRDKAAVTCVITLNGALQVTQPQALNAFVSRTDILCYGASNGTITVAGATGGYGTYDYSIGGAWQATGSFTGLAPASYVVSIRDRAHPACVKIVDPAVVITEPDILSGTATATMATCFGANDGTITISNELGGSGSYQYSVSGGTTWQSAATFTNLAAPATYDVRIRDAANATCVIQLDPALALTQPAVLNAIIASTNVTCFGGSDGTITISSPSGGYGPYEYSINGGGSWSSTGIFTAVNPGTYNILIRDVSHINCVRVLNSAYAITQPGPLRGTVTKTDVTCEGADDGSITVSAPSGGSGTYNYSIDGGTTWFPTAVFSNLAPSTYDIWMRDAFNMSCTIILYSNLVITEPLKLTLTSTGDIQLDCFGDIDGTGTFYGLGGTLPFSFTIVTNTTGATIAAAGFNSQSFFGAGAGTITVAATDLKGCFAQATITITQPLVLTPGSIGTAQVLCSGEIPAPLTENAVPSGGSGAYNYQWQYSVNVAGPFNNIAMATQAGYTPVTAATSTLYYRRMVTAGVCMPVYSNVIEVKVNPVPVAVLTGGATICPSQTSVLKVDMMAGTGPFVLDIQNHGVVTGYISGTDIIVTPATTTTYTLISARDANGCLAPATNLIGSAKVTVGTLPVITTSPVDKTTCEFGMVTFNVAATGTDLTYQWFENTGSGFNPVTDGGVYFGATGTTLSLFGATRLMDKYIYHAEVSGCSSTVTSADATLTVNTIPEIVIQPKDTTACMGSGADFSVVATGTATSYQWQVNKGSGFINIVDDANFGGSKTNTLTIVNAPASFNNYIVRVIVSSLCGVPVYSNFVVLRVSIPPVVTSNPVNKAVCDGTGPVVFNAYSSGMMDSLRWQVNSGGSWSDVHDNAIYTGSTSQQLTLITAPLALDGNQYRLNFMAKCTTITTTAANLTVRPNPIVNFDAYDPLNACGGVPIVINGNPSGGSGVWTSHQWTGDIGPLNNYYIQSPTFSSMIAGTFTLNYKVKDSNGCFANDDITVIVDAPDASFTQDKLSGCTPSTVTFTKDMTGIAKFWWDFNDGSPIDSLNANPVHTFKNTNPTSIAYHNVKLRVRSPGGCYDTYTSLVTVYPAVDATFTANRIIVCSGSSITFTSLPGASKYFWEFGDGVSGYATNTTSHMYTNFTPVPVVQQVKLTTTSFYNCTDVKTLDITVMPVPLPQFTALPVSQIYNPAGNPVTFTNATNPGTWTWLWSFGDGTTSAVQNPSHTYTALGTFDVILKVSNANCSDSIKHQVTVLPMPPVADFALIPSGCGPLNAVINNTSLNTSTPGTTYKWEFGDGSISTAKNPTYTWFDPGVYRVELTVTGPGGTSLKSQVVNVYHSPKASFEVAPPVVFVNDEKVRCFNLSQGADSYLWEFGDGDTSKVKEPYHRYMREGVYDITLWAYSHNVINNETVVCSDVYVMAPAVTVEPAGELRYSTVFTPNKDGEVDMDHLPTGGLEADQFFYPAINERVVDYKLQVFNRWGTLIFESHDINKPWNGYYQGKLCPQGVYVWYVEGKYTNGQPFKKVGDVTLLH